MTTDQFTRTDHSATVSRRQVTQPSRLGRWFRDLEEGEPAMSAAAKATGTRLDPDVFVSYRRTDEEFVERFVSVLEKQGPEVWWDADIGAGDDWRESIVENLADSDCLVIVFSKDCNDSTQLVKELAVADHLHKVVIPIKIDDAEPTGSFLYELAWRNWINLHPDPTLKMDAAAARIVESLKEAGWVPSPGRSPTNASPEPAPTPGAPSAAAAPPVAFAPPASSVQSGTGATPAPAASFTPPTLTPTAPLAPRSTAERSSLATADQIAGAARFRLRDAFPFHWADFVAPALLFGVALFLPEVDGQSFAITLGDALLFAVMLLASIGLIAFPIRYFRRRANPYRVARNLVISNLTFAVGGAIAGLLTAPSLVEEGETTGSVRIDVSISFLVIGLLFAGVSFVIFFALSRARAKRELTAHMETV